MKGICYRLPELSDCELYCCAESCPGLCIVKEKVDDDAILMKGFVPVALNDEEYMERAIRRYGEFSTDQLEDKALLDADGPLDDGDNRLIYNGKVHHWDSCVDLATIFNDEENAEYKDWALGNNWMRLDDDAYEYVTGERPDDEDYKKWVEETLK